MGKSPKDDKTNILIVGFFIIAIVAVIMWFSQPPVEFSGKISCNTGFVGLDISSDNRIQAYPCEDRYNIYNGANLTCFKTDNLLSHINLKNIDGLNCNMEYSGKGSSALMWHLLKMTDVDISGRKSVTAVKQ